MPEIIATHGLNDNYLGYLTSSVQFGFIIGTLIFAVLTIADRFSPSKVFMFCAIAAALCNLAVVWEASSAAVLLLSRFCVGFFLAGIYPVGMKIAADYFKDGLGKSLGFLVGALVLGTAFPHFLKANAAHFSWHYIAYGTASLSLIGGLCIGLTVSDGPFRQKGSAVKLGAFFEVFKNQNFRRAAFGYFGHMWELYTFWAFVPVILSAYNQLHPQTQISVPLYSFLIIAVGTPACMISGLLSQKYDTQRIAATCLLLSGLCCLLFPFVFLYNGQFMLLGFLFFWGMVVIADSPLFSSLVANNAEPKLKGTGLTLVNSLGFAITIVSIQLMMWLIQVFESPFAYTILALGPLFGLLGLRRKLKTKM
jgi:MFS family permease